jgi:quercetin dioxygenase-like cupin family protein
MTLDVTSGGLRMPEFDRKKIAADWTSRGFSCALWTDPSGQCWEDFRHATDELVLVLEGEVEFEIAGEVYHPQIGEELLIPAGAIHSVRNIGRTTARWLYGYKRPAKEG